MKRALLIKTLHAFPVFPNTATRPGQNKTPYFTVVFESEYFT